MSLRIIPLTLQQANAFVREHHRHNEPGTSLRASGWMPDGQVAGREWKRTGRPRTPQSPADKRWWMKYWKH